jgi:hypothetical protein
MIEDLNLQDYISRNGGSAVGLWVTYNGTNRPYLKDRKLRIIAENPLSVQFISEDNNIREWCAKSALKVTTSPDEDRKLAAKSEISTRDKILAEIATLEARLTQLKDALTIIDSL